jgi:hypothetical protein
VKAPPRIEKSKRLESFQGERFHNLSALGEGKMTLGLSTSCVRGEVDDRWRRC